MIQIKATLFYRKSNHDGTGPAPADHEFWIGWEAPRGWTATTNLHPDIASAFKQAGRQVEEMIDHMGGPDAVEGRVPHGKHTLAMCGVCGSPGPTGSLCDCGKGGPDKHWRNAECPTGTPKEPLGPALEPLQWPADLMAVTEPPKKMERPGTAQEPHRADGKIRLTI